MKKITYTFHSSPAGAKYRCTAVNEDVSDYETTVTQIVEASNEHHASEIFNAFLDNHFEDATLPWEVTIEEVK